MADVLILGGTRNLGHFTALALLDAGHAVSVLNRGLTADRLPGEVRRLRADRHDTAGMRRVLEAQAFDMVFDTTTYTGHDARQAVELFSGTTERYVFVSSGQVYLVREGLSRPFREDDYEGPVMAEPAAGSDDHDGWQYGVDKRDAEDVFTAAASASGFPAAILRLPMVASEHDDRGRIQCYIARLRDRAPLLLPDEPGLPLRHVYARDVARLVTRMTRLALPPGRAWNVSWGESMSLEDFVSLLARILEVDPPVMKMPRARLEADGLLPGCSPFSGKWMSELDNSRSLSELGADYTAPELYLRALVDDYINRWESSGLVPTGLTRRQAEVLAAYPKT
jgi:nucleoside-diphosphate-sugar epimerase